MKGNKQLYVFLAKCAGLYLLWSVLYYGLLEPHTDLQMWITSKTTGVSAWSLNQFYEGDAFTYDDMPKGGEEGQSVSSVKYNDQPLVYVSDSCNALTLIVLFVGFILAYPGDWRYKMLFIPAGTLAIFLINVVRVQVLILNFMYFREAFDFNHKYTFTIAVYLVVFWFWMLWANKFSKKKFEASSPKKMAI